MANINVEQIIVMIDSNIPNKEPFQLKSNLLYHPDMNYGKKSSLSELPFITRSYKYPVKKLYNLIKKNYKKTLKFFFDKKYFENKLFTFLKDEIGIEKIKDDDKTQEEIDDEILKHNVEIMIELLFPTKFPAMRNFNSSFNQYIKGINQREYSFKTSIYSSDFSYLNLDGNKYTITRITWLNDLFNHPIYRQFVEEFNNYSNWAENESKNIKKRKQNMISILLERIKNESATDSLNITKYMDVFDRKKYISDDERNLMKSPDFRDYEKKKFYDTLDDFNDVSVNFNNLIKEKEPDIEKLYSDVLDMNEIYKRLIENKSVTLKGVKKEFTNNLSVILRELKKINVLNKISNKYITSGQVNIKLEGEDEDVVSELKNNYKRFIDFINKINVLLAPTRESSNRVLQNKIINFSQNTPDNSDDFGKIVKNIKEEFILLKPSTYFTSDLNMNNLYTGVNFINKTNYEAPHYEIYLGIDVVEGLFNDDNLKNLECKYRGLYLGLETENYFSKNNKYDFSSHRVYVPLKEEITDEDDITSLNNQNANKVGGIDYKRSKKSNDEIKTIKGGRHTTRNKKYKIISRRTFKKNNKK
jgi:hypothetical protein